MTDYHFILARLHGGNLYTMRGTDYSGLQWDDLAPKPTKTELDAAYPKEVALHKWEQDMLATDRNLTRAVEQVIDAMDAGQLARLDPWLIQKHADKKALRGQRP